MGSNEKQERRPAQREIEQVAPGVARFQLPISMPGLGHVNCLALLDDDGVALVDPGLPGPFTFAALKDRLRQADLEPRHVHTVIVTHSHPDHFGMAKRLMKEFGAKVVGHRSFGMSSGAHVDVSVDDLVMAPPADGAADDESERSSVLPARLVRAATERPDPDHAWYGPPPWDPLDEQKIWQRVRDGLIHRFGRGFVPRVTHPVDHGDVLRLAGRDWFVTHTPGHTADHFCLHDPEDKVFIAGDHVLPTITPHISGRTRLADPLKAFFYSLDRVAEIRDVGRVLPAHGDPFEDLPGRVRAIKEHHHERLDRLKQISHDVGPASVRRLSRELFRQRSWGPMAESETYAHLEHLRLARDAERQTDGRGRFIYTAG